MTMRKLIRFRWTLGERGRGKRKDSCYIEPIEVFSTLTSKHCGDHTSDCSNGVLIGGYNDVRIRRLTPREVWRLQGFPDEYFDRAKAAGVSDSRLYAQAGNAVTVNVAYAIGLKLKEIENE